MFKFIFDLITEPLGLPIGQFEEWCILGAIGFVSYLLAYGIVGKMYKNQVISDSTSGSFFHWFIRSAYFVIIWAVTYAVIWVGKFVIAHKTAIIIGTGIIIVCLTILYIWKCRLQIKKATVRKDKEYED